MNSLSAETDRTEYHLQRLYEKEFHDIGGERPLLSQEDHFALQTVQQGTKVLKKQFEFPLPRRTSADSWTDNGSYVLQRLLRLKECLFQDQDLWKRYAELMKRNEAIDYVENAPATTDSRKGILYLPRYPVINPKKPEKLLVVFDCEAKFQGKSLKDRLLQGPDWTTPRIEVLCGFKVGGVALSADIRERFHQVKIPVGEHGALSFLW